MRIKDNTARKLEPLGSLTAPKISIVVDELAASETAIEKHRLNKSARKALIVSFAIAASYATVRYNVMSNVPWSDWPLFVGNKIIAVASLFLLVWFALSRSLGAKVFNSRLIYYAGVLALIHSVVSLLLITPAYFPKYFAHGKLTLNAGLSLLTGVSVMVVFYLGGKSADTKDHSQRANALAGIAFFSGAHAALIGFNGWFEPSTWPGGMPPLTLISFFAGSVGLFTSIKSKSSSISKKTLVKLK